MRQPNVLPFWHTLQTLLSVMPNVVSATTTTGSKLGQWTPPGAIYPRRIVAPEEWDGAIHRASAETVVQNADWVICFDELHRYGTNLLEVEAAVLGLLKLIDEERGGYLILQVETSASPEESDVSDEGEVFTPWEWWRRRLDATAEAYRYELTWEWRAMLELQVARCRTVQYAEVDELGPWLADQVLIAWVKKKPELKVPRRGRRWWRIF